MRGIAEVFGTSRRAIATLLLVGLALRESLSFWTGHPYDVEVWIRTGAAIAGGHNPYVSFWPPVPGVSFAFLNIWMTSAAYLPFWGLWSALSYDVFVGTGSHLPVLIFLLKQPEIAADLIAAGLLGKLAFRWTGRRDLAVGVLGFWCLFPYDILISAVWGQFDAIILVALLAALWVQGPGRRNVAYGLGIFVKWLPAIFLPLELLRTRGLRRAWVVLALAIPFLLTLATFVALGWSFTGINATATSQSHGGGGGMNLQRVVEDASIIPWLASGNGAWVGYALAYLWVPMIILAAVWAVRKMDLSRPSDELGATMLVLIAFLDLRSGLYEQYMLYLFPMIILDFSIFHPQRRRLFYFLLALCSIYLVINNALGIWFVSPLDPAAFQYALQVNASASFGTFRYYALDVLAGFITVTLAQLAYVITHPGADPRPWLLPRWRHSEAPVPPAVASPPG